MSPMSLLTSTERRWLLVVQLDTLLEFDGAEWKDFSFAGETVRWFSGTQTHRAAAAMAIENRDVPRSSVEIVFRFLSRLAFETGTPIHVTSWEVRGEKKVVAQPLPPKATSVFSRDYTLPDRYRGGRKVDIGYALYREGVNSRSSSYAFLCFYKVLTLIFGEKKSRLARWINDAARRIVDEPSEALINQLRSEGKSLAKALLEKRRHAIAHCSPGTRISPDDPGDLLETKRALRIVQRLARTAIKGGLLREVESAGRRER
jgi:hypothetical protein